MRVTEFLDQSAVPYEVSEHPPTFTAQQMAAVEHEPGQYVAKPVIVKADGEYLMCVLSACYKIDLGALKDQIGARSVGLAEEKEIGELFPDCELEIQDPDTGKEVPRGTQGEICSRGFYVMKEYYKQPEETRNAFTKDGWFRTGDLGTMDENGYIKITGRLKDMFITGGVNAYPAEIERALLQHSNIADVAVYGVPDERWGEVGKASIVPRDQTQKNPQEVLEFLEGKVGRFKIPKYVEFVDELPRTATGKIQKYLLAEKFKKGEVAVR